MKKASEQTVNQYIKGFPAKTQTALKKMKAIINSVAPKAEESISYGIPTFKLKGRPLIYIAGFKDHVSVFPASDKMVKEIGKLAQYRTGKGTIQFKLDKPIQYDLVKKMAAFLLKQHKARAK